MTKTEIYSIHEFKKIQHDEFVFFTCSSFEERAFCIPKSLDVNQIKKSFIFSTNATPKIKENATYIVNLLGSNAELRQIVKNDPFSYIQKFNEAINEVIQEQHKILYIDITTFNHEMLLILLKIIDKKRENFDQIRFLYIGAKEYSVGDSNENKWLSKGCKDIRSVLGYPGFLIPKKPTCLMILVGFEHERASALINAMEPDMIIIGHGKAENNHVFSHQHIEPMRYFEKIHKSLFSSRPNLQGFDFLVNDIESTMEIIKDKIQETQEYDHIIVPLNTKTSTLAIGLFALRNQNVQVCYAEPEVYNNVNYSAPGDVIVSYNLC